MLRPGSWPGVPADGCPRERGGVTSPAQHATMWCVDQPVSELEEVTPMLSIVGGMDIHRKQVTFDYLDLVTGEVKCGQIAPADRAGLRAWLERFGGVAGGRKMRAKTDKADSRLMRDLLAGGRLPECWIPPPQILEYRALLETYHAL